MRGVVAPFPLVEAVGRRQQFEGVDTEIGEIGLALVKQRQIGKIGAADALVDEGRYIEKGRHRALRLVGRAAQRPGRGQFVNHEPIVAGSAAGSSAAAKTGPSPAGSETRSRPSAPLRMTAAGWLAPTEPGGMMRQSTAVANGSVTVIRLGAPAGARLSSTSNQ